MALCRKHVCYTGLVQGVGFRFTARRLAGRFDVTGFVKNLADGSVEVVVEGEQKETAGYLQALEQQMHGYIENRKTSAEAPSGEFTGFDIRF